MKKVMWVIFLITLSLIITSCSSADDSIGRKIGMDVLCCFKEENVDNLKSMFCEKIQKSHDLDKEITEAMKFINGNIISYEKNFDVSDGESIDDGIVTERHFVPVINDIEISSGESYKITLFYREIDENYKERVGISNIVIRNNATDSTYTIGEALFGTS